MNVSEKVSRLQNGSPGIARLNLPSYEWWSEALHGVAYSPGVNFADSGDFSCATSFPEPIGLGATFDRELIHEVASTTSTEARALSNVGRAGLDFWSAQPSSPHIAPLHVHSPPHCPCPLAAMFALCVIPSVLRLCCAAVVVLCRTPNINIFRDPRWGRGQETPGEDPYLSSEYVYYLIRGYQEGEDASYYKVVADCKHYAGYDIEDWHGNQRYGYNAIISNQDLVETYLPSFKSCLKDAHVGSAMCSYNAVNGVPACANAFLMNDIARGRWGWEGWITSDCDAVGNIYDSHHYTSNFSTLVQITLRAGCDIDCGGTLSAHGEQAYADGAINDRDLDTALIRQFSSLVRLGYFDPASRQPYRQYGQEHINTQAAQELARRAARESIVLLKNIRSTLPLSTSTVKTIALIGPHTDSADVQVGNYNGKPCAVTTPFTALSSMAGMKVTKQRGVDVNTTDASGFDAAVASAKAADVIVYIGGINQTIESEGHDRNTIDLPGQQLALLKQLEATGKPLIVILFGGGGVDVSYLRDSANTHAILWAGYPSQAGGDAIADVLFGRYSPAGRLPVTWYPASYVSAVPMTDQSMRSSSGNPGRTYKFYTGQPVYAFGSGLSYSQFTYATIDAPQTQYAIESLIPDAKQDNPRLKAVALTVNVTNTGSVRSDIVVLAYVSNGNPSANSTGPVTPTSSADVTPPIKELFDYAHVHAMAPGSSQQLVLGLSYRVLSQVDLHGHQWLLPGHYTIRLQNEDVVTHAFELTGEPHLLEDFPDPSNPPITATTSAPINKHKRTHSS